MLQASQKKSNFLKIEGLHTKIDNQKILNGVDLVIKPGKITALMGPNGSGKSTLSHVLMGHPNYSVTKGKVIWQGKNILKLKPHQRAQMGLFLAFQYPLEIPGVNMYEFLLTIYQTRFGKKGSQKDFDEKLDHALKKLKLSKKFLERSLNEGFSGGEKKKAEILQLLILEPELVILDETDSGLDVDALKIIAKTISEISQSRIQKKPGILVITHYQRLLNYLKPDFVHIMSEGKIIKSGTAELAKKIEKEGYGKIIH